MSVVTSWKPEQICLRPSDLQTSLLAHDLYVRSCRTNFNAPGFCVVDLGHKVNSHSFRQLMVDPKAEMSSIHESETGETLTYLSAVRFDQQESTKPHLDGGPDECFLMLGYEPSEVHSELEISDHAKCAFDLGMTPNEFMTSYNPMFEAGYDLLRPYTIRIPCFASDNFQIVCINNSSASYSDNETAWQGTLHTANILLPDESKRRVINSTLIARTPAGTRDAISEDTLSDFIHTTAVRRRGYDKPHLEDDL